MAAVDDEHVIVADDYVTPDEALISNINPDLSLFPTAGREDAVYAKLMRAHPHLKMYRRAETPVNWHFRDATSPRVPPLMAIADPGCRSCAAASSTTSEPVKRRGFAGSMAGIRS
jgi:hypothetical protein